MFFFQTLFCFASIAQELCSYSGPHLKEHRTSTSCMDNICQQLSRYRPVVFLLLLTQTILNTTTSGKVISSSRLGWLAFLPFFPGSLFLQHSGFLGWALHQVPPQTKTLSCSATKQTVSFCQVLLSMYIFILTEESNEMYHLEGFCFMSS